ncbi:MAG TPA: peptidoglycan DD-metalloendopeptidase family protein [Solirubrobacteraceae bacterium]|jgi:murein DD-endopeptidase MepM/ murein hydrolase activator NlpD|nr:peptidoglycan DD-metalloendopeptidase family protein [Solirubrobacteraceae bacterium]
MLRHRRTLSVLAAAVALALAALGLAVATGIGRDPGPPHAARDPAPPLPRFRPRAVEPVAGRVAGVAPGPPEPTDVPRSASGHRISAGAPTDAQVREELEALQREQSRIERTILDSSAPIRQGSGRFIWPVFGPITSPFCERRSWEACHPGVDIGVPAGTAIRAADTGQVVLARPQGGYGNLTCIAHTASLSTCYAHQSRMLVTPGQVVMRGQVIGAVGCTGLCFGAHLHFEVRVQGRVVNPMAYL